MLVQVEGAADEEGNVIFHGQVQDVSQSIDLQSIGIFVVCAVDGVVEREGLPVSERQNGRAGPCTACLPRDIHQYL